MELKNNKVTGKKKKDLKRKRIFRIVTGFFLIVFSVTLGMLLATFNSIIEQYNMNTDKKISLNSLRGISDAVGSIKEIRTPLETTLNVLVMGSDISYSRGHAIDNAPTRSDTMMLVRIDPVSKQVNILSIPRDSRVIIPGHRYHDKINSAFAIGGERLARQTVANLVGVPVHHYAILRVNGLVNIIDIIGGVEIDVEKNMHYRDYTAKLDINLKKGRQILNGTQAHGYVRFRHDEIGDIGRVQRQQKFVDALAEKLLRPSTIIRFPELVAEVQKNIITDMTNNEMLRIGYFLKTLKRAQVKLVMLPGRFGNMFGISYWIIDETASKNVITEMFPDSVYAVTQNSSEPSADVSSSPTPEGTNIEQFPESEKRKYRITVLNGTEEPRLAAKASRLLRDDGWQVWSVGETKERIARTKIIVQTGISKPLPALNKSLGTSSEIINASVGDISTDYTIIVGNDFSAYLKKKQEELYIGTKKLKAQ